MPERLRELTPIEEMILGDVPFTERDNALDVEVVDPSGWFGKFYSIDAKHPFRKFANELIHNCTQKKWQEGIRIRVTFEDKLDEDEFVLIVVDNVKYPDDKIKKLIDKLNEGIFCLSTPSIIEAGGREVTLADIKRWEEELVKGQPSRDETNTVRGEEAGEFGLGLARGFAASWGGAVRCQPRGDCVKMVATLNRSRFLAFVAKDLEGGQPEVQSQTKP